VKRKSEVELRKRGAEGQLSAPVTIGVLLVAFALVSLPAMQPSPGPMVVAASAAALQTQPPPAPTQPKQLEGFVRADQLPQREELPAAPLVMAAYAVAWTAIFLYVWSIWHRLNRVEREMADVSRRFQTDARR
jgi:CcmD family protein